MSEQDVRYERTQMQKDIILQRLKEDGCRITRQRRMLLDIILEEDCSCCKEIYYKACKKNAGIGTATVYRMITTLEKIGAIDKKNMYRVNCDGACQECMISFDDDSVYKLSGDRLKEVILAGMKVCGYAGSMQMKSIVLQ